MYKLGYLLIGLAGFLGWVRIHPWIVLPLALMGTYVFAKARRQAVKGEAIKPGALTDGIYLLAIQILIMFTAFAVGYFLSAANIPLPVA